MKFNMIQILKNKGWLVVTAALTIILSACTRDNIAESAQQQAGRAQKITVTVGAGFDADAATRSDVVYNETDKTRTLIFTKGDKLFFYGGLGEPLQDGDQYYYIYKLSGFLTMVEGSLSSDGKSAVFTGDLNLLSPKKIDADYYSYYEYEKNADATYDFEGKDPISLTTYQDVRLMHENTVENKDYEVSDEDLDYILDWAADVKTLMTTKMNVGSYSEYDAEKKSFKLHNMSGPVFNCTISGLAANTTYQLSYLMNLWDDYVYEEIFPTPIKADAQGTVAFAIFAYPGATNVINFTPLDSDGNVDEEGKVMEVNLGALDLKDNMVYNISRTATTEVNNKYIVYDENGEATETMIPSDATIWTGTVTPGEVAAGTYVVDGTATCAGDLTLKDNIKLILKDGASLTVSGKIDGGQSITIYGQTESTGKLSASGGEEGIAILANHLTVHGGVITVSEADQGIETEGDLKVHHGTINATGVSNAIISMKSITISGGEVTAVSTGEDGVGMSALAITISGSSTKVNASGNMEGIMNSDGTITIEGGEVTATAGAIEGTFGGVGIEAAEIIINGGNVKANGGDAAAGSGVPGGAGIDGAITVNGGTVTAKGGNGADTSEGNGGDGGHGITGEVSVIDGSVTATGGDGGKGGDGGESHNGGNGGYGVCGTVTGKIDNITATGGKGGAAGEGGIGGEAGQDIFDPNDFIMPGD